MNFDIKDMKSWANRNDVKVGDSGYVANDLDYKTILKAVLRLE